MVTKDDMIYDLLLDVKKKVDTIDSKQDLQSDRLNKLEQLVDINTKDLTDHKEGVIQNRKILTIQDKRLELLERPKFVFNYIKNIIIAAGGFSGAIYGIYRLLHAFGII